MMQQQQPACDYCRSRKRKCDRQLPRCSLCTLKNQICAYTRTFSTAPTVESLHSYTHPGRLGQNSTASPIASDFPSSFFLDYEMFTYHRLSLSAMGLTSSPQLNHAVSQPLVISDAYFDWAHLWMPIVSKKRWYTQHVNPLTAPQSQIKVLLLCMKLVVWTPGKEQQERQPRTEEYVLAKQKIQEAEILGAMSVQLLQAMLLLTIYEYAHAIYPSAFMTIAACARYATALKLHKQRREDLTTSDVDLDQQEERRRVWWAVIIMDRILSPDIASSPEPQPSALLPLHDQAWDDGLIDESALYEVSSPASLKMGMLARLAQASYLLGRVLRHRRAPTNNVTFDREERKHLQQALRALLNLTYEEGSTRLMPICPQTALCLSAMVTLNSPITGSVPSSKELGIVTSGDWEVLTEGIKLLPSIAHESLLSTEVYYRNRPWSLDRSSPLLLHWTYLIAVTFLQTSQSTVVRPDADGFPIPISMHGNPEAQQREAMRGYLTMRRKLGLLGQQWCAADEYLRILDVRSGLF